MDPKSKITWSRIARRIRVPLGFALAALYIWLAHPTWQMMAIGGAIAASGLALRAAASGHVRKDAELTTSGPYGYTRNPLYLGSLLIGIGFALAARSAMIVLVIVVLFFAIYLPVIKSEEDFLRATFDDYTVYERHVPRLLPRAVRPAGVGGGEFSWALYRKHREYNAAFGAVALMAALAVKILWKL
jgi:protein-S-isoprenylcysteine O-methyltransferase Ste14